tara:strand:- start:87 stop:329 length:243 start_codon:yes stop_codon:yes gene_type:complete
MARSKESYTSKGERRNVSKKWTKKLRKEYINSFDRLMNQYEAHKKFKKVMLTVSNPNTNETNKPFVRVRSTDYWISKKED